MHLFIYHNSSDPLKECLQALFSYRSDIFMNCFNDFEPLYKALKACPFQKAIVIFSVIDEEDIIFLKKYNEQLFGVEWILILPDRRRDLSIKGYSLYPRLVVYPDMDLGIIKPIVDKMIFETEQTVLQTV